MLDQPPTNRAERRRRGRPPKGEAVLLRQSASPSSKSVKRQQESLHNLNTPLSQDTGISNGFGAATDFQYPKEDYAPSRYADTIGESEGFNSPATFSGYRGKYGLIKTNIVTTYASAGMILGGPSSPDGMLFLSAAESIADAWIAWGKADPRYMRLVNVLFGGAFMTLVLAHAPLAAGLMANHGVRIPSLLNPLSMPMFKRAPSLGSAATTGGSSTTPVSSQPPTDPFTANYRPVGAHAPTEEQGPPPGVEMDAPLRVYPDEGIPSDVDVQLRQLAQTTGVPYAQIRDQYLLETAQDRIAQNNRVVPPSALGVPVTRPEV